MAKTFKIIDVSSHNQSLNWGKLKADGVHGLFIRAGYGWSVTEDDYFRKNVDQAEAHDMAWGPYLYSYATTMEQATVEVNGFMDLIRGYKPTLPVVIDTEDADKWRTRHGNPSWQVLADMLYMQLEKIEKAGYYAMYYASRYWVDNLLVKRPDLKRFDLWLAHWDIAAPSMPCGVWQYTSGGPKYGDGIDRSDLNIGYVDYPTLIKKAGLNGWPKLGEAERPIIVADDTKPVTKPTPKKTTVAGAVFDKYENATFIFGAATHVRTLPTTDSQIVATYDIGESVEYDQVYIGNGYVWISYIGQSGNRRYCAVRTYRNGKRGKAWGTFK